MRILVWQWGRYGAGPRFAAELARAFNGATGTEALLSLSAGAELLASVDPPPCALPVRTYTGMASLVLRALETPVRVPRLAAWLRAQRVDVAICAMPAPLDFEMAAACRRAGVPYAVVVHDADTHPGDRFPAQARLQRRLVRGAAGLFALSTHVADRLRAQGLAGQTPLHLAALPPFVYGKLPPPPGAHGGTLRLLSFGRLLPYKGLDLLADSLDRLGNADRLVLRVVGSGPETPVLQRLRAHPFATVENRWVPEDEVGSLLGWSDALVLSHREASQSGVAAAAIAARRWLVATRVGGLAEQLRDEPLALMCDPDADSIASAITRLLDMPRTALAGMAGSGNGAATAWDAVAAGMVEALRKLG